MTISDAETDGCVLHTLEDAVEIFLSMADYLKVKQPKSQMKYCNNMNSYEFCDCNTKHKLKNLFLLRSEEPHVHLVLVATNLTWQIDEALWRPGDAILCLLRSVVINFMSCNQIFC